MMSSEPRAATFGMMLLLSGLISSCGKQDTSKPHGVADHFRVPLAQKLQLDLTVDKDSVLPSQPVRVTYTVANKGPTGRFRNDPGWLFFEVVGPNGERLKPATPGEVPYYGFRPDVILPAGGFFGTTVDLRCGSWQYGLRPDTSCAFAFDLSAPGRYKVLAHYVPSEVKGDSEGVRSTRALDLVDSVDFVVIRP